MQQLYNHLAYLRRKNVDGLEHMSFDQLAAWCTRHSDLPEDEDEPFVCCFQVNIDDDDPENFPEAMDVRNPKGRII